MHCKPGQMAIRIKNNGKKLDNELKIPIGAVVICLNVINNEWHVWDNGEPLVGIVWQVEYNGDVEHYALRDDDLMPIDAGETQEESAIAMEKMMGTTKEVEETV